MSERKRTIMLGFHSPVDAKLMKDWLTGLGYEVVESLNDTEVIDLVLMDSAKARLLMDRAFKLKRTSKYFLPVLVCIYASEDVRRWIKAGFDDVLRMPATKEEWLARIEIMLRLRRQSEELSQKSEYLHRALIEFSNDHIFLLDTNGTYVSSNDRVAHFGLDRGTQLIGKNIKQVFPEEVASVFWEQFQQVLNEGKSEVFEHVMHSDRGTYYFQGTLYPVNFPDGTVMVGGIYKDITERKQAEEALRESEVRNRIIAEMISDYAYIFRVTTEGKLIGEWVTESFTNVFGYTIKEVDARGGWQSLVYPDDLPIALAHAQKVAHGEEDICEMRWVTSRGEIRWLRDYARPIFDETNKRVVRVYGASQDITERKQAEEALRKSKERLNYLFAVNPAIVYQLEPESFSTLWVSPNFTEITGYTLEEALQSDWWIKHVHPEDREEAMKAQERLRVEGRIAHEYRLQKKDGTYIWVRDELRLLRDEHGTPKEIVGSWMNITDRKEAEIALAKSEQRYRSVVENTGTAMLIVNKEGSFVFANKQCISTLGYSLEELQGTNWRNYVFADDLQMMEDYFKLRFTDPEKLPKNYEVRLIHADGSIKNALLTVSTISGTDEVVVSMLDITERKRAEEELRKSEARLKAAEKYAKLGHWELNHKENVLIGSDEVFKIFEIDPSQFGRTYEAFLEMVHPDDREWVDSSFKTSISNRTSFNIDHRILLKDGKIKYVHEQCETFYDEHGNAIRSLGIIQDITERIRAEETRRVLETAIDNAQECIMVSDRENRLTYVNRAFERLTGYSAKEVLGKTLGILKSDRHDQEFYQRLKSTIYSGHPWRGDLILKKKNGEFYEVAASITPILNASGQIEYFVSVHRDITKEREMERRIHQNQRLEAIGTLAGGIAHDFNNFLTPILGYTEMCMYSLPSGNKARKYLEEVMRAATRATELVQQILSFSRRSNQERKPIKMAVIIKEALKLLRSTIPTSIEIKKDISATEELVIADPTEIHQVIMNLCINASQAMPEGGQLSVSLHAVELDQEDSKMIPGCSPGKYLKLSVEDTGHGIAPEIIDKIFEPYFTTKEKGTGLGLATTHSIVTSCGGGITVTSQEGKGTRFDVYFPVASTASMEEVKKNEMPRGGHERILVVDDDISILNMQKNVLEEFGYSVTTAADPEKALAIFKKSPSDFDLVITDMTMPRMTGDLLASAFLKIRPDVPVVVMTGFSERMNEDKAKKIGIRRLISKPISVNELLSIIREIFDTD